jgi:hypothetical protein
MKTFTIRDIDCEEVLACDDGDLILRHCRGDLLYLYPNKGHNGLPKKAEFNLRLSKKLVDKVKKYPYKGLSKFRSDVIDRKI